MLGDSLADCTGEAPTHLSSSQAIAISDTAALSPVSSVSPSMAPSPSPSFSSLPEFLLLESLEFLEFRLEEVDELEDPGFDLLESLIALDALLSFSAFLRVQLFLTEFADEVLVPCTAVCFPDPFPFLSLWTMEKKHQSAYVNKFIFLTT